MSGLVFPLHPETVDYHGGSARALGTVPDEDGWNFEAFQDRLRVKLGRLSDFQCELDLVAVDASLANAIRRILLAEVPTVAIENVYIWNNTTLVQDEILSQRLGLIPLAIDPRKVEFRTPGEEPTDLDTIVFSIVVACDYRKGAPSGAKDPDLLYSNSSVYSSALTWQPKGEQETIFADDRPRPVFDDILIAKLRPKQEIVLEMHCEKGIGKDHAKWSPVATASYRLLPHIDITKRIPPELCSKFAACFAPGVIEEFEDEDGTQNVRVANARKDTVSREVLRHAEFADSVKLGRIRDHFIFNIESVGQMPARDLFPAALDVLLNKIRVLKVAVDEL